MTQTENTPQLSKIVQNLNVAISQTIAYNTYVDAVCFDDHLSNCLIDLTSTLIQIDKSLTEYIKITKNQLEETV